MRLTFVTPLVALCTVSLGSKCAKSGKEMTNQDFVHVVKQKTEGKIMWQVGSKHKSRLLPLFKSKRGDILIKFKNVGGSSEFATRINLLKAVKRIAECNDSDKTKGGWTVIGGIKYIVNTF